MVTTLTLLVATGAIIIGKNLPKKKARPQRRAVGRDITYGNYVPHSVIMKKRESSDIWMLEREVRHLDK
jgi:hypothetical protein